MDADTRFRLSFRPKNSPRNPPEELPFIAPVLPNTGTIGAIGASMAITAMLRQNIMPCTPILDVGFDFTTVYGPVVKRVQVKSRQAANNNGVDSLTFSLLRNKAGISRNGTYASTAKRGYSAADIDVFIFVHIEGNKFYIMPSKAVDFSRQKITFRPDSHWADAWWVLQQE